MEIDEIRNKLEVVQAKKQLVRIKRDKIDSLTCDGFIIAVSSKLCLFESFSDFCPDGYQAIRLEDITGIRSNEIEAFFTERSVALGYTQPGGTPPPFEFELSDWKALLKKLKTKNHHVALHAEILYPDEMQVGKLIQIGKKKIVLKTYSTTGQWKSEYEQPLRDLTMVQFGDRYINAFQTYMEESN